MKHFPGIPGQEKGSKNNYQFRSKLVAYPIIVLALLFITGSLSILYPGTGAIGSTETTALMTAAERSDYTRTTLYEEVINLIFALQAKTSCIKISSIGTSTEGRMIPIVIISREGIGRPQDLRASNKPVVLINANIHAGEIEGKEASLMLIREFAQGKLDNLLENQVVLVIPIFNPDGNEKLGQNRRDNGPELAGMRPNGQHLDLNRDFLKLESPEVKALVKVFDTWNPVLFVDLHTTDGSYHREPVTYMTQDNPNGAQPLMDYMWKKLFPATSRTLKEKYGYDSLPYGNFADRTKPSKGWMNHAFEAMYGTNYAGLRNMFTILDENYSHADFKTRVLGCFGYLKSILEYTNRHIREMQDIQFQANRDTVSNYSKEKFALDFKNEKLMDVTIKSYVFEKEKIKPEDKHKYPPWYGDYHVRPTEKHKDYKAPYFSKAKPTVQIDLPQAYIIAPFHEEIVKILENHGIRVERTRKPVKTTVEKYIIENIELAKRIYQGHVSVELKGKYIEEEITIQPGSYYISLQQPLARIIPLLLEPACKDSLAAWGFFNRELVRQWSMQAGIYPVYRLHRSATDIGLQVYED